MNILKARELIKNFLIEDINTGDLSSELVFDENMYGKGVFIAKDNGIICGTKFISLTYEIFGDDISVNLLKKDGEKIEKGEKIAEVVGLRHIQKKLLSFWMIPISEFVIQEKQRLV